MDIAGITITHPDKILYPQAKITKADLAEYYAFIAEFMLPHIKNRPLSLKQFPTGITHPGFFHKHAAGFYPTHIPVFEVDTHKDGGHMQMVGVNTQRDLVYFAGQNAIEFHMPTSKIKSIEKPDQIILDFDPSDDDFEKVRTLALASRELLAAKKMQCFVKTTGGRGLHVHIPIKPEHTFEKIKPISKEIASYIQTQYPDIATIELRKNKRGNRVFIDYLRNDYAMTAVAAYSLRPNPAAGVATPIHWEELQRKSLHAQSFTIKNIRKRMQNFDDPWADFA